VRTFGLAAAWLFFLENVLFPNQHQEYGVLSLAAWRAGKPYAEPILLKFAADQIGRPVDDIAIAKFTLPVEPWVYPAWMIAAAMLTLVAARVFVNARWAATAIAASYVAYRCVMWGILVGTGFPPSAVPFALIGGAVLIDIAFLVGALSTADRTGPGRAAVAVLGALAVAGGTAGALWVQTQVAAAPPAQYDVIPLAALVLAAGWIGLTLRREPRPVDAPVIVGVSR
jgi:hypothetical protein